MESVKVFFILKDKCKIKNEMEVLSVSESASVNVYWILFCFVMGVELDFWWLKADELLHEEKKASEVEGCEDMHRYHIPCSF